LRIACKAWWVPPIVPGARAPLTSGRRRWLLFAAGAAAVVLVVALVVAELALPGIAAQRVRDRVERYGAVRSVAVHAQPALELLWNDAESIAVHAGPMRATPADLVGLQASIGGVGRAELRSPELDLAISGIAAAVVPLSDVRLAKRGEILTATGLVRSSEVHASLPAGFQAQGLYAESGRPEVDVSGEVLGARLSGRAALSASEGRIVVEPEIPFGSLATVTVFADPRVYVEAVTVVPDGQELALTVRARRVG
jgi:hypothetical protein